MFICISEIIKTSELGDLEQEAGATGMEGNPDNDMFNNNEGGDMDENIIAENEENPNEEEEINSAMEKEGIMTNNPMSLMQSVDELQPENQDEIEQHQNELDQHNQFDPEIPEEHIEEGHIEDDGEHLTEEELEDHGLIVMDHHSELEKMKNFKKISEDCNQFMEEFRGCLDNIPDPAWEETEIQKCVGKDFTRIVNTINYEKAKIIDRAQQAMRQVMIKQCYEEAGETLVLSDACDLFEKDLNKLLWAEMNFYELMVFNKDKYTFVYEKMSEEIFHTLVEILKEVYEELSDLIDEIDAHRDVIVVRLKGHVDARTNHIVEEAKHFARNPEPKIQKYNIEVTQSVSDPTTRYSGLKLPRPLRKDKETQSVFDGKNPYQDIADKIELKAHEKIRGMYTGTHVNEVKYDPDHLQHSSKVHQDHQNMVMAQLFHKSVNIAGDPVTNPSMFVANMTGQIHNMPEDDSYEDLYGNTHSGFKTRKLNMKRRYHNKMQRPKREMYNEHKNVRKFRNDSYHRGSFEERRRRRRDMI